MNQFYRIRLMVLCGMVWATLVCSQQPTGSVCISEETGNSPDSSAILQIKSRTKGVLFPRMSFEAATNIENKKNGLIVFITDTNRYGYWFWNSNEAKWLQFRDEETTKQDVEAPVGGIIMYAGEVGPELFLSNGCGKPGTKMEGWHICNEQGETPNLVGRFIRGEVTRKNETGGTDSIWLKMGNMPKHEHKTNPVSGSLEVHSHALDEPPHNHSVTVAWNDLRGRNKDTHFEVREDGTLNYKKVEPSSIISATQGLKTTSSQGTIDFNIKQLRTIPVEEAGQGKGIENRPSYCVLVYLMRVAENVCPTH